jgi:penicillin-binding protein 1A
VVIESGGQEESWRPENYTGIFYGPTRLREALVHSRNLVSIRLLRSIGIDYAIDYLARFGFQREQMPRGLSLALGTASLTPLQLTAGYAVFASGGLRVRPQYIQRIRDFKGQTVWQASGADSCIQCPASQSPASQSPASQSPASQSGAERTVSPQNAYLITSMMADVMRRGTARDARSLGRQDLAGKTGTTNDWNDAWFCGFNGALLVTTWVGFDQPHSLGQGETGAHAALPMWMGFMEEALKDTPERPLVQPPGLVTVRIDPDTGLLARPNQRNVMFETFQEGYAPTQVATVPLNDVTHPHEVLSIPEQLF